MRFSPHVASLLLLSVLAFTGPSAAATQHQDTIFGDYAAAPRKADHVDSDQLIRRLKELKANTYMWLIWQNKNDWDDLQSFLPKAQAAGISVWAYLAPPSETPIENKNFPYSEPYRLDYIQWTKEIAKLSLQHPNLVGYVIDDFWGNVKPGRFTPEYIKDFVHAGKSINPSLKFYPLLYFPQLNQRTLAVLAPVIDGVVAAYPRDEKAVQQATNVLNDRAFTSSVLSIAFPRNTNSNTGDHLTVSQQGTITAPNRAKINFHYKDDFDGKTTGYREFQLRIDDQIVWRKDIAGHDDTDISISIPNEIRQKSPIKISLGIADIKGVGNFPSNAEFSNLSVEGIDIPQIDFNQRGHWKIDAQGAFSARFEAGSTGEGKFSIPIILMLAGETKEYETQYHEDGTLQAVANKLALGLQLAGEGKVQGIVTYCLDKSEGSSTFNMVKNIYELKK